MYEELFEKDGKERLEVIDELSIFAAGEICRWYKKCAQCPLAIVYHTKQDYEPLLCVDVATRRRVENALAEGGRFLKRGEKL